MFRMTIFPGTSKGKDNSIKYKVRAGDIGCGDPSLCQDDSLSRKLEDPFVEPSRNAPLNPRMPEGACPFG